MPVVQLKDDMLNKRIDQAQGGFDRRMDVYGQRLEQQEARFKLQLEQQHSEFERRINRVIADRSLADLQSNVGQGFGKVDRALASLRDELLKEVKTSRSAVLTEVGDLKRGLGGEHWQEWFKAYKSKD
ncbi:hypothetical protein JCM6882_002356 [Rhodosporidiobolus microsporus]